MKLPALVIAAVLTFAAVSAGAQTIVKGPLYNPDTGSRYYVLEAANWNAARAKAVAMGGDMASIENAAENEWIRSSLVALDLKVFIGLSDSVTEGTFAWSNGSGSTYVNWHPNNQNSNSSDYVYLEPLTGKWLTGNQTNTPYSVIEIKGPLRVPQEFPTFTDAMSVVSDRLNEIQLAAGDIPLGGSTSFASPGVRISVSGEGMDATRLIGPSQFALVYFAGDFSFKGLTFFRTAMSGHFPTLINGTSEFVRCRFAATQGYSNDSNIRADTGSTITFSSCRFEDLPRGAMHQANATCNITLINSLFRNMPVRAIAAPGTVKVVNCTFTGVGSRGSPGVIQATGNVTVLNSIFWDNGAPPADNLSSVGMSYCDVEGGYAGTGNIEVDPMFTSVTDRRLKPGSPCIDAGDGQGYIYELLDCAGGLRIIEDLGVPNTGRGVPVDMGCFERQSSSCPADFDGSGFVDIDDFTGFVQAFESGC